MASFKEYQMMFQLSATTSAHFQSSFAGAQTQIAHLQGKIDALNKTQGDITAYQKQQAAVEATKNKLGVLAEQYALLKSQIGEDGQATDELKNKMLAKQLQIESTTASLNKQNIELETLGNALDAAGIDTSDLTNESKRLGAEMVDLRSKQDSAAESATNYGNKLQGAVDAMESALIASGVKDGFEAVSDAMQECAEAAITFETAMAGVRRTVGGSDSFLDSMATQFKRLSTEIPITTDELAGIATTAGQLGVSQDYVMGFTETMAKLGTATDLTADQASTMLAQFANITGTTEYDRLGSVVAELGDATATTASKVVEMSQGMAAAASTAGMSETDIMAIAAAVGSLGIESQAGSTAMSTLISTLYTAVETGDKLDEFASVAGMTAEQFKIAWGRDAVSAMDTFIQGLNNTERNGKSAIVVLDELGIKNVRQTKAILGLANADGLLSKTIAQANKAWVQNTALTQKASIMYNTTEAKLTKMNNAANNVRISIGEALTPAYGALADAATRLLQPISEFIDAHPELVQGVATFVGVAGGAITVVLGLAAAFKAASAAALLLTPGIGQVVAIIAGAAGLTAGVVALVGALGDAEEGFGKFDEKYDAISKDIAEKTAVSDLISEYQSLYEELGLASESMKSIDGEHSIDVTLTPVTAEDMKKLKPTDFVDGSTVTLDAAKGETMRAEGLLTSGTTVYLNPAALEKMKLEAADLLKGTTVSINGTPGSTVDTSEMVTGATAIQLTPEIIEWLAANDFLEGDDEAKAQVILSAEATADLAAKEFLKEGDIVKLKGDPTKDVAAGDFVIDDSVALIDGQAKKEVGAGEFVKDGAAEIHGTPLAEIEAGKFLKDGTKAEIHGDPQKDVEPGKFVKDEPVAIIGEAGNDIAPELFVKEGETASIPGKPRNTIAAEAFVDDETTANINGTPVQIGPEAFVGEGAALIEGTPDIEKLIDQAAFVTGDPVGIDGAPGNSINADEFVSDQAALIHGAPDTENPVDPAKLVSGSEVPITLTLANLPELQAKAEALKQSLTGVDSQLGEAKRTLADLETKNDELKKKLLATNETDEKLAYQKQMESLAAEIETARGNVESLQTSYDGLNAEYSEAQGAVDELQAKEARLYEIGAELAAGNADIITSTDATTEAFYRQVEAVEALNNMKLAELRAQAYDNIVAQAKNYAAAVQNESYYQNQLNIATEKYNQTLNDVGGGAASLEGRLINIYETLYGMAENGTLEWDSEEVRSYRQQVEELITLLTGEEHVFNGFANMEAYFDDNIDKLKVSHEAMETALREQASQVTAYQNSLSSAEELQQTFLNNLVSAVTDGGMSIEYLEELLREEFAQYENGAEIAADAMDYVRKATEGATEAAEDFSSGVESTAASALDLQNAVAPVAEEMAKLSEAYDKAYDSAKNSLDGQFELFEIAKNMADVNMSEMWVNADDSSVEKSNQSMREALDSQAKWFEEYNALLQQAQERGLNTDLLASIADGSAESAELLKRLTADSTTEEDIKALNAAYETVGTAKEKLAGTMADIETDFTDTMAELQTQMETTVDEMNLSNEAADAAQATFQAMIAKADEMKPLVAAAYMGVANAAQAAFARQGLSISFHLPGYANGTYNAPPGLALVGENGPELIHFGGGEQVLPAEQTEAVMHRLDAMPLEALRVSGTDDRGGKYEIVFSPTYTINGNQNAAELETMLREHDESMRSELESMLEEIESDRARRAYE